MNKNDFLYLFKKQKSNNKNKNSVVVFCCGKCGGLLMGESVESIWNPNLWFENFVEKGYGLTDEIIRTKPAILIGPALDKAVYECFDCGTLHPPVKFKIKMWRFDDAVRVRKTKLNDKKL